VLKIAKRAILWTPALALLVPLAAQAADPAFCNGYADAAVRQVYLARTHPACAGGAVGTRWSPNRPFHFNWCLGVSPAQAATERQARTDYLRGCGG
jgi:hypothetical protein